MNIKNMEILDDDAITVDNYNEVQSPALNSFDPTIPEQIFYNNRQHMKKLKSTEIKHIRKLGQGAQGEVHEIALENMSERFVGKSRKILNNSKLANQTFQ